MSKPQEKFTQREWDRAVGYGRAPKDKDKNKAYDRAMGVL